MKHTSRGIMFLITFPLIIGSCNKQSYVEEYTETLITYPFSDTNPLPIIQTKNDIYPYSRIDGFSHKGTQQEWKVVKLENEYVEVYILPEIGGKVWGAIDKSTGKEFIYMNDVVKFRDVAMRGPWTSGGIEWNSGVIGHHPGGAAPVNYRTFTDDEGTAHCIVGGMDLPSHLQWRVDIALPSNTSYFESRTFWYNDSPLYQSYYHWNNAAVKSAKDLHFYFPGNYRLGHDGLADPWPVDKEGVDRSWYKNNTDFGNSSYHVMGSMDNYFVSYYHDENFGSGHWSPVDGAPGKKIWLWSQARDGAIWEELLTDTHGQYVEVQAGRMFNQNSVSSGKTPFKQPRFAPYNADGWVERWFPVRGTGGVTRVVESGTLHISPKEEGMFLLFSPICEIRGTLIVRSGNTEILHERVDLLPSDLLERKLENISEGETIEVSLDNELIYSSQKEYLMDRPRKSPGNAISDMNVQARELENRRAYRQSLETYLEILEKDTMRLDAAERVSELYYRKGDLDRAEEFARSVLETDAYLPGANFIYGCVQKAKGDLTNARDGFQWAVRSPEYRSASFQQLAAIDLIEGNLKGALTKAKQSLVSNKLNLNSYKILAIAHRLLGDNGKAAEVQADLLKADPLNQFVLYEAFLLNPSSERLNTFKASFQNEMAKEEYLEIALFYHGLGMQSEAVKVLEEAPEDPVVLYWLAWLHRDTPERSEAYLTQALECNPEFVFPYRTETLEVLLWAAEMKDSWLNDYYTALILWHRGEDQEALGMLNKWGNEPGFVPFYYARAHLTGVQSPQGIKDMQRALEVEPDEWRIYRDLADIYFKTGDKGAALQLMETGYKRFPGNYILDLAHSKYLTVLGEYEKSLEVLENTHVLPFEGENTGQRLHVYNHLLLAHGQYKNEQYDMALSHIEQSEQYPENLGSGSPAYPDYRDQNRLRKMIYEKTGRMEEALEAEKAIREYDKRFGEQRGRSIFNATYSEVTVRPY
jgi:tetratricopeptide (TPR) repeat protein